MRPAGSASLRAPLLSHTVALEGDVDLTSVLNRRDANAWIRADEGFVGLGRALSVDIPPGQHRFDYTHAWLEELFASADIHDEVEMRGSGPVAFGAFTFDPRAAGSTVIVPEITVGRAAGRAWMTLAGIGQLPPIGPLVARVPPEPPDEVIEVASGDGEQVWLTSVRDALADIAAGGFEKVVLARDRVLKRRGGFDASVVARALEGRYPECFTFSLDGMVGASPELLVRRTQATVESMPLAGSAPRGIDPAADERLGEELSASTKNRREHEITVRSVADAVTPLCTSVRRAGPSLLRLANVQHLATSIRGTLEQPLSALQLAGALHPSAAVCGAPARPAMGFIRSHEGMARGRYGGPVGWVDANGDGEWALALRCAQLEGDAARLFAGAGIVAGSDPDAELEETRVKLEAVLSVLG